MTAIKLIVGLGNPGPEYENTRHNAGTWFVNILADNYKTSLKPETKFKGLVGSIQDENHECKLLIPLTYMNKSGTAIQALANFYKIPSDTILVAHDELDFSVGKTRLKYDGGAGGHNGLEDIIRCLGTPKFYRLRIGIGRPTFKDVANYVLAAPSKNEKQQIIESLDKALTTVDQMLHGDIAKAMQIINT